MATFAFCHLFCLVLLSAAVMSRTDVSADTTPFFSDDYEGEGLADNGVGSPKPEEEEDEPASGVSDKRAILTVIVLCYINLLNYMDRFTVAGNQCY